MTDLLLKLARKAWGYTLFALWRIHSILDVFLLTEPASCSSSAVVLGMDRSCASLQINGYPRICIKSFDLQLTFNMLNRMLIKLHVN